MEGFFLMRDEMKRIVICKYCGNPEYYGKMRWLSGKCTCRDCYRKDYEENSGLDYAWNDLDGPRPTMAQYENQEKELENL